MAVVVVHGVEEMARAKNGSDGFVLRHGEDETSSKWLVRTPL